MSSAIEINLVPGAQGRGRPASRGSVGRSGIKIPNLTSLGGDSRQSLIGGALAVVVLLALYSMWNLGARRSELESLVQVEVRDSTRFATTIALVESLQARQDTMQLKIGIIQEVDQRRYVWPHLLNEISSSVPAYTWISHINALPPADTLSTAPGIAIQGNAGSTQALTRLMKNLESSPFIRDVTLVTSEQTEMQGRAVHRFSLEARYETPDPAAIETMPVIVLNSGE